MKQRADNQPGVEEKKPLPPLYQAIVLDLIGMSTYLWPAMGEWVDIVWAPVSAWMFLRLFGGRVGTFGALINFTEEILPFSDFVPTFTIAWILRKFGV